MERTERILKVGVWLGLVGLGIASRLQEHLPNFTPLASIALFAGFYFDRRWVAATVPLAAMFGSDLLIGGYEFGTWFTVYVALLLPLAFRGILRRRLTALRVLGPALVGSFAFFLATNLAVWVFDGMYDSTWAGLVECYVAALPFYRFTLYGDLIWSTALFGGYALVVSRIRFAKEEAARA